MHSAYYVVVIIIILTFVCGSQGAPLGNGMIPEEIEPSVQNVAMIKIRPEAKVPNEFYSRDDLELDNDYDDDYYNEQNEFVNGYGSGHQDTIVQSVFDAMAFPSTNDTKKSKPVHVEPQKTSYYLAYIVIGLMTGILVAERFGRKLLSIFKICIVCCNENLMNMYRQVRNAVNSML